MKSNLHPWRIVIPIMVGALALIGASAPAPSPESSDGESIPDYWLIQYGLDPSDPEIIWQDTDGDGLENWREYQTGDDPFFQSSDFSGNLDGAVATSINSYYIQFGAWYWAIGGESGISGEYFYPRNKGRLVEAVWSEGGAFGTTYDLAAGRVVRALDEGSKEAWWQAAAAESNAALNILLNRGALTNDVICAVHLMTASAPTNSVQPALHVDLLTADGQEVVYEDLYGNILTAGTNEDEETLAILEVPTAYFPDAAIIRLRAGAEGGPGAPPARNTSRSDVGRRAVASHEIVVYEALLYEVPAFDQSEWNTGLFGGGQSGGGGGGSTTNWARTYETGYQGGDTNSPADPGGGEPDDDEDQGNPTGVIIVDQSKGSDSFDGRSSTVMSGKIGPKKTVGKGMAAVDKDRAHTLVIKSGTYNENLNISGKNVRVVIDGKVKL